MATASPVDFDNWNGDYLNLLQESSLTPPVHQFYLDLIETINLVIEQHNALEARVAALEP